MSRGTALVVATLISLAVLATGPFLVIAMVQLVGMAIPLSVGIQEKSILSGFLLSLAGALIVGRTLPKYLTKPKVQD